MPLAAHPGPVYTIRATTRGGPHHAIAPRHRGTPV